MEKKIYSCEKCKKQIAIGVFEGWIDMTCPHCKALLRLIGGKAVSRDFISGNKE